MYPEDLRYAKSHEWIKIEGDTATVGITQFAADELGDVVYLALPNLGDRVTKDQAYGSIESVKAVSDLLAPVSGQVVGVNQGLADSPEVVNGDPYGEAWMIRIRLDNASEADDLLDATTYQRMLEG